VLRSQAPGCTSGMAEGALCVLGCRCTEAVEERQERQRRQVVSLSSFGRFLSSFGEAAEGAETAEAAKAFCWQSRRRVLAVSAATVGLC
jgi:hypothetical protein